MIMHAAVVRLLTYYPYNARREHAVFRRTRRGVEGGVGRGGRLPVPFRPPCFVLRDTYYGTQTRATELLMLWGRRIACFPCSIWACALACAPVLAMQYPEIHI